MVGHLDRQSEQRLSGWLGPRKRQIRPKTTLRRKMASGQGERALGLLLSLSGISDNSHPSEDHPKCVCGSLKDAEV